MKNHKKNKKSSLRFYRMVFLAGSLLLLLLFFNCIRLEKEVEQLKRQVMDLKEEDRKNVEIVWSEEDIFGEEDTLEAASEEEKDGQKKVYLTFDDGPSVYTEEILKVLREYGVKATFFVTGAKETEYDKMYARILEEGHTLGIHTYSHVYRDIYSSLEAFQMDFNKMRNHIYKNTGEWVNLYRFPGGSGNNVVTAKNRQAILAWMKSEGIVYFDWNVAPEEVGRQKPTAQEIAKNCLEGVEKCKTAIVLLHDAGGKKSTLEALPLIIEGINKMEDTVMLPIDQDTATLQQISLAEEGEDS